MSLLSISSVGKRFGPVAALRDVSLEIAGGSRTAIVGASGSGKSTLLRLIAGFEMPDDGTITLAGQVLAGGSASTPAHLRGIGCVTQDGSLFPHLTVAQNVAFGMQVKGEERERRVRELLEMVGLDAPVGRRHPDQLSGGQQQRIALARALAQSPRLMLLDEPFSALDAGLRAATRRAVMDVLARASVTSVLVTHDHEEALTYADQVAVLVGGQLAQCGSPRDVYWHPRAIETARLLGEAIFLPAVIAHGKAETAVGALPVGSSCSAAGEGLVMLRPEQFLISAADANGSGAPAQARVTGVEFAGGRSRLTLSLLPTADARSTDARDAMLVLWHRGPTVPSIGSDVRLEVEGSAHVIDPAGAGR